MIESPAPPPRRYDVVMKQVVIAFVIEGVIIVASLFGNYSLIPHTPTPTWAALLTYMAAPVAYAATEIARVPLALATRTQTSFFPRFCAIVGLVLAAGITTKSMVSLGERMYHPRQMEVLHAKQALKTARTDLEAINAKVAALDAMLARRASELSASDERLKQANSDLGTLPPQKVFKGIRRNKKGQAYTSFHTQTDPRVSVMANNLRRGQDDRNRASERLDEARAARTAVDPARVEAAATEAETVYREAVLNSQLHALTAMILAKDPTEVTDGEVYGFLRYFVFLAAICVAFSSSLVALTAVRRITPSYELDETDGAYILGPYAQTILDNAVRAAEETIRVRTTNPTVVPVIPAKAA